MLFSHLSLKPYTILFLLAGLPCCKQSSSTDQDKPEAPSSKQKAKKSKPSVRPTKTLYRDLLAEAQRAELHDDGLTIDLGTPDQHKYTRGGWSTGWSLSDSTDTPFSVINEKSASLTIDLNQKASHVSIRAKSSDVTQPLDLVDGKSKLLSLAIDSEWKVYKLPLAKTLHGPKHLKWVRPSSKGSVSIDWIKFSSSESSSDASALPRVMPLNIDGRVKRSLSAPSSRTYSFYLTVPKDASLIFDAGSNKKTSFAVSVSDSKGNTTSLWTSPAGSTGWNEIEIPLSEFQGKAIRLDFISVGELATSGWGQPALYVPKNETKKTDGIPPPKNIIMVVLDTTRADAFAPFYENTDVQTPFMDEVIKNGTSFKNTYNNENWTKPSTATIMSGLYSTTHTARRAESVLPKEVKLFSEHLQSQGFYTGFMTSNAVLSDKFGFNKGWDTFTNYARTPYGNGKFLYQNAAKWLEERPDPNKRFFLYVQSVDAHTTYEVPAKYSGKYFKGKYNGKLGQNFDREEQVEADKGALKLSETDLNWVKAMYKGEITYQDEQLETLLKKIKELGLDQDTMIVITNDHGEELKEHGHMDHGWTLYDEMIRAPLVFSFPKAIKTNHVITDVFEHVDLAPTLSAVLGVETMDSAEGQNLMPLLTDQAPHFLPLYAVSASRNKIRSIRVGDWKLFVGASKNRMFLFNIKKDPLEKNNVLKENPIAARLCEIYLGEALASPNKKTRLKNMRSARSIPSTDATIDEETRKELEALGYL